MSKRVRWAGIFSVFLISLLAIRAWMNRPGDELLAPQLVPLIEGEADWSFRGLHATHDSVVLVGGNQGRFGFSLDGGLHWIFSQVPGATQSQFRSVHAFNAREFLLMSAGAPTYIFRTEDAGQSWFRAFEDTSSLRFMDGLAFASDSLGWAYGDPIDGKFALLVTRDGGRSWTPAEGPEAIDGEASFAASGSGISYVNGKLSFNSGGVASRFYTSTDSGRTWSTHYLDLIQGLPSQGAFAHHWLDSTLVVVGGDYLRVEDTAGTALVLSTPSFTTLVGQTAQLDLLPYTSDLSHDGTYWYFAGTEGLRYLDSSLHVIDTTAMHSLAFSGSHLFASGPHGRVGRIFHGTAAELDALLDAIKTAQKNTLKAHE